ncbi:Mur ligase [Limtongia smithiae]|uniref:Mur ligase n=1 Tax=Limtongia smithiae TaxID=1125753 RepID=UPI0034CEF76C
MAIRLGTERIIALLAQLYAPQKNFRVFHVGGTNGKGSVCAYLSSILTRSELTTGRFTSPHLLEPRDAIAVNDAAIGRALYADASALVRDVDERCEIGASKFEIQVATAMEVFARKAVDVAVIEVGLGGATDATNVDYKRQNVLGTIITRIGVDHQKFLGNTVTEIAHLKAGIMRSKVPCTIHGDSPTAALDVLLRDAQECGSPATVITAERLKQVDEGTYFDTQWFGRVPVSDTPLHGAYQQMNLACALAALDSAGGQLGTVTAASVREGIASTQWPGRLQLVPASKFTGDLDDIDKNVLVDGAHNVQAALSLAEFVDTHIRPSSSEGRVTWVIALSGDREPAELLPLMLRAGDRVYATTFGAVEDMPWIVSRDTASLAAAAESIVGKDSVVVSPGSGPLAVVREACREPAAVVVCGSLYLAADVLRGSM